jgi:type II secretion system protein N
MAKIFSPIFSLLRNHKLKMLIVLLVACVFAVVLFPNDDLSDWLSMQIVRNTGIYVQFDNLGFDILPSPGVGVSNVFIEAKGFPPMKAEQIHAEVLLSKLISLKYGFSLIAQKLFRGEVNFSYGQGDKTSSGQPFDDIALQADKINLDDLFDYLQKANLLQLKMQGSLNINANLHLDHSFTDQPSATTTIDIPALTIPSQSVMVDFNGVKVPQVIPTLDLGHLIMKNAKLSEGILDIPDLTVGDSKSEVFGKIKGSMGFAMRKSPSGPIPEIKAIDLTMDINLDNSFIDRNQKTMIGGFLFLIPSNLKTTTPKGTRLAFHLKVARPGDIPSFTPLTEKL